MKKIIIISFLILSCSIFSQNRYALVIGNSKYNELSELKNPKNDAADISNKLKELGFSVTTILDSDLYELEESIFTFKQKLSESKDNIGFFYYAGHGIQFQGQNFLIPVDTNIPSESYLKTRAFSTSILMDELNLARNELNIVVLDACRDNPFGWSRSSSRGLTVIGNRPAGSIVVYATSEGDVASDGEGRNGLFTSELLKHLNKPDTEIEKIFKLTGKGVQDRSNGRQIPAIYNKYFGEHFLNKTEDIKQKNGVLKVLAENKGTLYINDELYGEIDSNKEIFKDVPSGVYSLKFVSNGEIELYSVVVTSDEVSNVLLKGKSLTIDPKIILESNDSKLNEMVYKLNQLKKRLDQKIEKRKPYIWTSNISFGLSGVSFLIGGVSYSNALSTMDSYSSEDDPEIITSLRDQFTSEYNSTQLGIVLGGSSLGLGIISRIIAPDISDLEDEIKDLEMEISILKLKGGK